MLAVRLPTILPAMELDERLEITKIHSVEGGPSGGGGLVVAPPFRTSHHTVSDTGLMGEVGHPRPGETCLAHQGVLSLHSRYVSGAGMEDVSTD